MQLEDDDFVMNWPWVVRPETKWLEQGRIGQGGEGNNGLKAWHGFLKKVLRG